MIDLSNNNGVNHDYARALASGHHRVYFKASESVNFTDRVFPLEGARAHRAGFRVGAYHFAHGTHSPREEFDHFVSCLHGLAFKLQLRPALDLEYSSPRASLGAWALEWLHLCRRQLGCEGIVYGSGPYLEACKFKRKPGGLWLASYGRDDGFEHPYHVPAPWKTVAAHQYSSQARVPGIRGRCDISRVMLPSAIDWPGH
jgi:lysozyme